MSEIIVLGAGMVGIATALELQARGHDVIVADRSAPGRETSFGNAGIIQAEAAEPYTIPRDLPTLIKYALGSSNDVTWTVRGLRHMAPALAAYFRNSAPARHAATSRIYSRLTARSTEDHRPLIEAAGAGNLISKQGYNLVFRDARGLDAAARDLERLKSTYGLKADVLDGTALKAEEPAITDPPAGAIHWHQSWTCNDPGGLTAQYANLFLNRGGAVVATDASTLRQSGAGWAVGDSQQTQASRVVVALGPWSPEVLAPFGYRIPMVLKRGYHGHFDAPVMLRRPLVDTACGVVASTMAQGLRITTGAAIVARNAAPDHRQLLQGRKRLSELIKIGAPLTQPPWFGTRPCMPGMLPVVGEAPRHPGLWFHFGHGHHGFTLGPTTAHLLADAIAGETSDLLAALSPTRL